MTIAIQHDSKIFRSFVVGDACEYLLRGKINTIADGNEQPTENMQFAIFQPQSIEEELKAFICYGKRE